MRSGMRRKACWLDWVAAGCITAGICLAVSACQEGPGEPGKTAGAGVKAPKEDGKAVRTVDVEKTEWKRDASKIGYYAVAYHNILADVAKVEKLPQGEPPKPGQIEHREGGKFDRGLGRAGSGGNFAPQAGPPPSAMPAGAPRMKMAAEASRAMPAAPTAGAFAAKAADAAKVGVTAGGMQDIGQARRYIAEGKVPVPEMITVEGLLGEHDIPLEGEPTGKGELYGSASVAWTLRYGQKVPNAMVQIGFGLDMELDKFSRKPLNLAVVVDVSGSMQAGDKMNSTKAALNTLVDRLNENDRLAIVLFNHQARLLLGSEPVKDKAKIRELIKTIGPGGSTSIEAGMDMGYRQVAAHLGEKDKSPRVFLLTDAMPNVGVTSPQGFQPMMEGAAALGIGVSAFGVGIDFGQHLAYQIFQTRGANYFYLENAEKIRKVFDDEFDFMVTPVAYDIAVELKAADGVKVVDVLGVPDFKKESGKASIRIPSLFLSKRQGGGATMVALEVEGLKAGDRRVAEIELGFATVAGEQISQKLIARLPGSVDLAGKTPYFSQPGAKKAVLLADAVVALRTACRGVTVPTSHDVFWNLPPEEMPAAGQPGLKAAAEAVPVRRRMGPVMELPAGDAKSAAEGLGRFADWFASQIGDVPGVEKELRLIEQLESTLRKLGGLDVKVARNVPGEVKLVRPPEIF